MELELIVRWLSMFSSWIMTFWFSVGCRVWIREVGLFFCLFLFKTIVNSLSPLPLRDAIFLTHVSSRVRSVLSISSIG